MPVSSGVCWRDFVGAEAVEGIEASRDGKIVARERGRGIGPALLLFRKGLLAGSDVADHIVGRAAAAIFVAGGVAKIHADVMSEGAAKFLSEHGIPNSADVLTSEIVNRRGTGPCPMEAAVKGLDDPKEMVAAVERTLRRLAAEHVDKA